MDSSLAETDIDISASVLHVRQTLVRVKNHTAPDNAHKTTLIFQEPKTAYSRRTVPIPAECLFRRNASPP